jgi:hypothetical protein
VTDRAQADTGAAGGADTVWRHAPGTSYVDSPERVVIVDLDHLERMPYVFAGPAAEIWACLDGESTESQMVAELAEAFEVSEDVVAGDVHQFLDRLRDLGLVVATDPGA